MANGYLRLHPNISMHILHAVLYTFHNEPVDHFLFVLAVLSNR